MHPSDRRGIAASRVDLRSADSCRVLLGVLVWLQCSIAAQASEPTPADVAGKAPDAEVAVELMRDRQFQNGVRPPGSETRPGSLGADAPQRWTSVLPETPQSAWQFVTVAESTRFCDNPATPTIDGATAIYASVDGSKRFEADRETGRVRFVFDTEREWRNGCNLSLPLDGVAPRYLSGHEWNWPHLLLEQAIGDPTAPDGRLRLSAYHELLWRFEAELLHSAKGFPAQCPPGTWGEQVIPDHCLFYAALVLSREKEAPGPQRIYALYPLFYSNGGERYDEACIPWLGDDPVHAAVYFTPNHVRLEAGVRAAASIDAVELASESVAAINQRRATRVSVGDYFLSGILIGWEVWGAYATDIQVEGLSFEGRRYSGQRCAPFDEYVHPESGDRLYTAAAGPDQTRGYTRVGTIGLTPTRRLAGVVPLYGYWHEAAADHYYTTDLLPFGFDGYVFQGRAGYVFAERSHPGQAAVHQYWNAERTSHRYSTEHAPSGLDGGYAYERCVGYVEAAE